MNAASQEVEDGHASRSFQVAGQCDWDCKMSIGRDHSIVPMATAAPLLIGGACGDPVGLTLDCVRTLG